MVITLLIRGLVIFIYSYNSTLPNKFPSQKMHYCCSYTHSLSPKLKKETLEKIFLPIIFSYGVTSYTIKSTKWQPDNLYQSNVSFPKLMA